jgi:hypothetical protein
MSAFSALPEDYSGGMALAEAMRVIMDHRAREWEAHRETREAAIRARMDELLRHADQCQERATECDRWASEYPAAHRKHHQYRAEADRQRKLKADAMRMFRQEKSLL